MKDLITFLTDLFAFDQSHPLLFTQFNFWAFFIIIYAIFCAIVNRTGNKMTRHNRLLRNGYLFIISLFFYYKTSGLFVLLLILSTFLGYVVGIRLDSIYDSASLVSPDEAQMPHSAKRRRKAWMLTGVIINLAVLCYFKYAYFFTDVHNTIWNTNLHVVNRLAVFANHFTDKPRFNVDLIALPVGISFFTFQNISYIVDVYRRRVGHASNVLDFGFYTTFFPQLVAGPIIRADQFIPQLYKPFFLSRRQFGIALFWIINGLMKKIILSDYLAVNFVDRVFDNPLLFTPFENFASLMIYSLQVYADFSGYTDIAIGVAMLMGFYLPKNFNSPYKASSPAGFWKRWHMSLSNWLKDYLYIPLGGNRNGTFATYAILFGMIIIVALMAKSVWVTLVACTLIGGILAIYLLKPQFRKELSTNINNMDTMLLGGMWHGASFNFITWGGLNGLGILAYKWWKNRGAWTRIATTGTIFFCFALLTGLTSAPVLRLFTVWSAMFFFGVLVRCGLTAVRNGKPVEWLDHAWDVLQTFLFISFTRLFFRSGSNLNPAEANEVAWNTAKQMANQIGTPWQVEQIMPIINNYKPVFLLFVFGMLVHWLPEKFKRRYRIWFASMPIWLMVVVTVLAVFIIYQFITADLQPFIYFQF